MTMDGQADINYAARDALAGLAIGDLEVLEDLEGMQKFEEQQRRLNTRTFALVKSAALVALDAPPASYLWPVADAPGCQRHAARPHRRAPHSRRTAS